MPRAKPADRIRQLEEQRARINAEIQRVRSRESQAERKRETRRKILVGAMVLDQVAGGSGRRSASKPRWIASSTESRIGRCLHCLPSRGKR